MSIRGSWDAWEREGEDQERFDAFREYYDDRDARLKKLGRVIEAWRQGERGAGDEESGSDYEEVGRLEARLEATRHDLEEMRGTGNWEALRDDVDQTISDLEEAIGKAAPRFQ